MALDPRDVTDSQTLGPLPNPSVLDVLSKRVGNYEYSPAGLGMLIDQPRVNSYVDVARQRDRDPTKATSSTSTAVRGQPRINNRIVSQRCSVEIDDPRARAIVYKPEDLVNLNRTQATCKDPAVQRLVLTARLRHGAHERARELAGAMATRPRPSGVQRFGVYLSESDVLFLVEAPNAELIVREIFDDPVRGTEISPWLALFDGPLHRAYEVYHWSSVAADMAE
jgi:hypothetical protein